MSPQSAHVTVLIVMQDKAMRSLAMALLKQGNFSVLGASSERSALRHLKMHPEIDVLLADLGPRELSSIRLAEDVGRLRPGLRMLFTAGLTRQLRTMAGRRPNAAVLKDRAVAGQMVRMLEALFESC
jgi:DNA-binding NtrC family response regulator